MKLSMFSIITVVLAFMVGAVWFLIKWAFSKSKCPWCKTIMEKRFNEKNMEYEYECPNCGYGEKHRIQCRSVQK
jgi:predicted RNA-binding Zn-ribbon protein involved in translation (DUF1610 family)